MKNLCQHFSGGGKSKHPASKSTKGTLLSLLLATCTAILTACNDEEAVQKAGNPLQLSFGINAPQSRGLYTDTKLPDNSPVRVRLAGYADYANLVYTGSTTGSTQTWTPNKDVKINNTYATLYAYWPYNSTTSIDAINVDMTAEDQTDWLYATPVTDINYKKASVAVTMNHALANINITIKKGTYLGEGKVSQVSIQSASLALKGTFNAVQETPDYTSYEGTGERLIRNITTTVGDSPINIMALPTGKTAAVGFYITIDDIEFYTQSDPVLLEKGNSYQYTLTLSDISTYMDVTGFSMTPWVDIEKDALSVYEEKNFDADLIVTYNIDESLFTNSPAGVEVPVLNTSSLDISTITRMQVDGSDIVPNKKVTFTSPGQHVIKYSFIDHTKIPKYLFYIGNAGDKIKKIEVPEHIESIDAEAFYDINTNAIIEFYSKEPPAASGYIIGYQDAGLILVPEGCKEVYETSWTSYVKQRMIILEKGDYIFEDGIYYSTDYKAIYFTDGSFTGTVNIKEGVTSIGQSAFQGNSGMTGIVFPESLVTIGEHSFAGLNLKGTLNIPNSVASIGYSAMRYSDFEHVILGSGLTNIGDYGLGDFDKLKTVTALMPKVPSGWAKGWTNRKNGVFLKVNEGLASSFKLDGWFSLNEGEYILENGVFYSTDGKTVLGNDGTLSGNVIVKNGVITINDYAFYNCPAITGVSLPNSVQTIGEYAFSECSGLQNISLGKGLTYIGVRAFEDCSRLTEITLGENITDIGYDAFRDCASLKKIISKAVIPPTVNSTCFYGIGWGGSLFIPNNRENAYATWMSTGNYYLGMYGWDCWPYDYVVEDGIWYSSDGKVVLRKEGSISGVVTIKEGVTTIKDEVFKDCKDITNLILPNSLETIGKNAFYGCKGIIGRLTLPSSLKSVGESAFQSCIKITGVTIQDLVEDIGFKAFYGCTGLTEVNIGKSVKNIGGQAFYGCTALNKIVSYVNTEPIITNNTFYNIKANGVLYVPTGSINNYSTWMSTSSNYLGYRYWTIQEMFSPSECVSLSITAENVRGNDSTTRIHYTAICNGSNILTGETQNNVSVTGTVISDDFGVNPSQTDSREVPISFTYMGKTVTTTITQSIYLSEYYTIDLNEQWQASVKANPDNSLYDGVYESFSNYHVANSGATMTIKVFGYTTFTIYIRSYAESTCDYVMVSALDQNINNSTSYSSTSLVKAHTRGSQNNGIDINSYKAVTYEIPDDGQEHTITIVYRKDGSTDTGDDKGYLLIAKP